MSSLPDWLTDDRDSTALSAMLDPLSSSSIETLATEAKALTLRRFGRTMTLYAPLYLSNHTLKRLICMAGLINDPLDEAKENCCWTASKGRLYITVLPGHDVLPHEEFFISYGNQHWCSTKHSFELLQ